MCCLRLASLEACRSCFLLLSLVACSCSITVTFANRDGSETTVSVPVGTNMLQAAHDNDIDLEGTLKHYMAIF